MKEVFFLPNILSLSRAFFVLLLLSDDSLVRCLAIVFAALSDFFDGFFARKYQLISKLGTLLDPITDKVFVGFALCLFFYEGRITTLEVFFFLLRDISLFFFLFYLTVTRSFQNWKIRSFFCGKMHTTCQFIALILLAADIALPLWLLGAMGLFGAGSFFELVRLRNKKIQT